MSSFRICCQLVFKDQIIEACQFQQKSIHLTWQRTPYGRHRDAVKPSGGAAAFLSPDQLGWHLDIPAECRTLPVMIHRDTGRQQRRFVAAFRLSGIIECTTQTYYSLCLHSTAIRGFWKISKITASYIGLYVQPLAGNRDALDISILYSIL